MQSDTDKIGEWTRVNFLTLRQARVRVRARLRVLRWDGSHSAEVNENINLYSRTRVTSSFRLRAWFRAVLLCLILKRVLAAH